MFDLFHRSVLPAILSALCVAAASCGRRDGGAQQSRAPAEPAAALAAQAEKARAKARRLEAELEEARAEATRLENALAALGVGSGEAGDSEAATARPASSGGASAGEASAAPASAPARPSPSATAGSAGSAGEVPRAVALSAIREGRVPPGGAAIAALAARPAKNAPPISKTPYRGAIAIDDATGRILFADNPDVPCLPASMVKMMDLLLVQEAIERGERSPAEMVGVSVRAFKTGGSQVYLDPKERFSLEDMLYALMIQSANDAAVAIAEHVAGSCEEMVRRMNERAAELGMEDTRFSSVHGLPASEGQDNDVTTPRDMAILARELCRHPDIFKYTGTEYRVFRPAPRLFEMRSHNPLLQASSRIEGADGLKTGYTKHAGYGIAGTAVRNGHRVIVVMMGVGGPDPKTAKATRNAKLRELFDRAFAEVSK